MSQKKPKCKKCGRENVDLWLISHYAYRTIFAVCIRCLAFHKEFEINHEFLKFLLGEKKALSKNRLIYQEKTICVE